MSFRTEKIPEKGAAYSNVREASLPRLIYYDLRSTVQTVILRQWWLWLFIIFVLAIYLIYRLTIFHTESSYIYHYENMLTGQVEVYDSPGTHLKIPFASRVTRYNKV